MGGGWVVKKLKHLDGIEIDWSFWLSHEVTEQFTCLLFGSCVLREVLQFLSSLALGNFIPDAS